MTNPLSKITATQWLRIAVVLVLIGLVTEILAFVVLTPATFMAFVIIGLPAMGKPRRN